MHTHTPTLMVSDPRGHAVRTVAYHRDQPGGPTAARVNRHLHDAAGRQTASWDPRLWARSQAGSPGLANLRNAHNLAGNVLSSDSVDAGWWVSLPGSAGQPVEHWDSRGSRWHNLYDGLLRITEIIEQVSTTPARCAQRFSYAGADAQLAAHNQCGRLIRHDDGAGRLLHSDFALGGQSLKQTRQWLQSTDLPDWPDTDLEPGPGDATCMRYGPVGDLLEHIDARGNGRRYGYTLDGALSWVRLKPMSATEHLVLEQMRYNAQSQVESQTTGNGMISQAEYDPADGRLMLMRTTRGTAPPVEQLHYTYDPVGNLTRVEDLAQPVRYFANQQIKAINRYSYDSLYQLVEARGRESASSHIGPALPELLPSPIDASQLLNYTQSYRYDPGGNLLELQHVGATQYTRRMQVAADSNRAVALHDSTTPLLDPSSFDANGNLQQLANGQSLRWDAYNQLSQVITLHRNDGADDVQCYVYDGSRQRVRTLARFKAKALNHIRETRYLPGLETHHDSATGEQLQVIHLQAGRCTVRCLIWSDGKPDDIDNHQLRYSLTDPLGSSTLEVDGQARLLSQEGYFPYGGTAWWAARSAVQARYKTLRYSGKERDASGLYYYGFRYYAPWLQRWINPDPAGAINGLNLYQMCGSNPTTYSDADGRVWPEIDPPAYPIDLNEFWSQTQSITAGELTPGQGDPPLPQLLDARPGALWGDGSGQLDSPYNYFTAGLDVQLAQVEQRAGFVSSLITSEFTHLIDPVNPYRVTSKHQNGKDEFTNTFLPDRWLLQSNFKASKTTDYHANDVIRFQYGLISKNAGFYGSLPSVIENVKVMNKRTIEVSSAFASKSPALLENFLNRTPIGKGTRIALIDFGMEPLWVSYQADQLLSSDTFPIADIRIGVQPRSRHPATLRSQNPAQRGNAL